MKKGIKLGAIALSILAIAGTIVSVNAQSADYTAEVCLYNSGNVCTLDNYDFGDHPVSASTIDLTAQTTGLFCDLLANDSGSVTLELTDLTGANGTIAASNFTLAAAMQTSSYYDGSLSVGSAVSVSDFSNTETLYSKTLNEIGHIIDAQITIDGTIPAGQAAGTYQGTLHLLYPAGTVVTCS